VLAFQIEERIAWRTYNHNGDLKIASFKIHVTFISAFKWRSSPANLIFVLKVAQT
jgi:hypothetical protein